jgi:hypothetical protein
MKINEEWITEVTRINGLYQEFKGSVLLFQNTRVVKAFLKRPSFIFHKLYRSSPAMFEKEIEQFKKLDTSHYTLTTAELSRFSELCAKGYSPLNAVIYKNKGSKSYLTTIKTKRKRMHLGLAIVLTPFFGYLR